MTRYREQYGKDPIIVVVPGLIAFGRGPTWRPRGPRLATFTDALRWPATPSGSAPCGAWTPPSAAS